MPSCRDAVHRKVILGISEALFFEGRGAYPVRLSSLKRFLLQGTVIRTPCMLC